MILKLKLLQSRRIYEMSCTFDIVNRHKCPSNKTFITHHRCNVNLGNA